MAKPERRNRRITAFQSIIHAAGCAYLDGEELHLTPIEYKLLLRYIKGRSHLQIPIYKRRPPLLGLDKRLSVWYDLYNKTHKSYRKGLVL